jgi:peptidoglycan/LPS O-acetylase OafA/YrhL
MSLEQIILAPSLDFSGLGKAGVYLFFSLSAFLLTWQALDAGGPSIRYPTYWAGYFLRRILRIYPLYFTALVASFVLTTLAIGYAPQINSLNDLIAHLLLQKGTSIYWAIPVEFFYYLVIPFVVITLWYAKQVHFLAPVVTVSAAIVTCSMAWPAAETTANSIQLGPYLVIFLLGSLMACICAEHKSNQNKDKSHILSIIGFLALFVVLLTMPAIWRLLIDPHASNQVFHKSFILYGLLWSICIMAAMRGQSYFVAMFELVPLRFLGRISFSIYLWHYLVIQLVARDLSLPPSLQFLLVITITLPLSWISYRFIERPFITWGHRKTENWQPSP